MNAEAKPDLELDGLRNSLCKPMPKDVEDRLRQQIDNVRGQFATEKQHLVTRRRFGLLAIAAGGLGVAVAIPSNLARSPAAWAEVVETLHERPWIHFSGKRFVDGTECELWMSFSLGIFAMKAGELDFAHFQNKGMGDSYWYRTSENVLHRDEFRSLPGELGQLESLLAQISSRANTLELAGPDEILAQSRRDIVQEGVKSWEYEFKLKAFDEARAETYVVVFEVDPDTRLLKKWTRKSLEGKRGISFDVDYPSEGPNDIYALGVPRSVKLDGK